MNSFRPPARLHLRQVVLGEPVVIPQVCPEILPHAGVKEVEVRLADVDVVDGGVGVELLVPLLDERVLDAGAVPLLDAVLAHNLEDAEADVVAVAAAAGERGERDAEELASHAALGALRSLRDAGRHHLLHVGHVLALVVAAGVPGQLSHRGQTERRHHRGGAVWTRLNRLRELVVHPAEALVQRAGLGLLPVREGLEHAGSARGLERDDEVADDGVKPEFALDDDADHALDVLSDAGGKVKVTPSPPILVRLAMPSPKSLIPPVALAPCGGGAQPSAPSKTQPQWSSRLSPSPWVVIFTTRVPLG